jgi:hypothetical protein
MVARYSLAGWHDVRSPNGPVFDGGIALCSLPDCMVPGRRIALCSPTEWRDARPRDCIVFTCRIAWCPAGGLDSVTLPDGTVFNRGIVQCSATGEMAIFAICERTFNQERRA